MKVSKYFVIACTALMVSSCADEVKDIIAPETPKEEGSKEESSEVAEMIPVTVTVGESSSRISHTDNGNTITVAWEANDVIYLGNPEGITTETFINAENSGFSTLTIDENSISSDKKTASFTGKIPSSLIGRTLLAFYGSAEKLKVSNSQVIMDFTQQTQSEDGLAHLKGYDLMSATVKNYDGSSQINLQFKHEGAILKVSFSGLPADGTVSKVVLNLPDGSNDFVTSKTFGTNGVATNGATTNSFELNVSSNYDAVFTLCPITFSSDMNVTVPVTKASGIYSYESAVLATSGVTLAEGTYNKVNGGALTVNNELEGAGSEASPYIIDNAEKFKGLSNTSGMYYQLSRDLDFNGIDFTTISTFDGTLDGNGKTISNLTFSVGDGNGGIFGTNNGTIKNLTVDGATITKQNKFNGASNGLAVIAGINSKTINNCIVKNSNIQVQITDEGNVGLITGFNKGTGSVTECLVEGASSISTLTGTNYKSCIGGLIGKSLGNVKYSFVESCNISYDNTTTTGANIGGLIGQLNTSIEGCYAKTVININTSGSTIGGLLGAYYITGTSTLNGCYAVGLITLLENSTNNSLAGLIGNNTGPGSRDIKYCYTSVNTEGKGSSIYNMNDNSTCNPTECYYMIDAFYNNIGIKSTASELQSKLSTFNNLGWTDYEFVVGTDDEPLIIQKKQ